MKPFGVLATSVSHFVRGLPLALALAVVSMATMVGLFVAGGLLNPDGVERALWPFVVLAWIVFTHLWLALFLTAWRLRRETPGFRYGAAAVRAAAWAVGITVLLALAAWSLTLWPREPASFTPDRVPPRWHPVWLGVMAGWAAMCGFGLPARAMLGRRDRTAGIADGIAILVAVAAWLVVIDFVSLPARTCHGECWGFMEGGIVMVPLLGLWLFLMTAGAAALSAAVWSRTVRG